MTESELQIQQQEIIIHEQNLEVDTPATMARTIQALGDESKQGRITIEKINVKISERTGSANINRTDIWNMLTNLKRLNVQELNIEIPYDASANIKAVLNSVSLMMNLMGHNTKLRTTFISPQAEAEA